MKKVMRERDAEVTREAIMEAAEEIFADEGFDGARVDAIAAKSGYNKSLIFHYFGDKHELYRAIIKRLKARLHVTFLGPMLSFVQSSDDMSVERMRLFLEMSIECYLSFLTENPRMLRIMAWEAAEYWQTFLSTIDSELEQQRASIYCMGDFLRRGQEAGIVNQQLDIRFLICLIGDMCTTYLLNRPRYTWLFAGESRDTSEELVFMRQQIIHLICHGILNSPEGKPKEKPI